MVNLTLAENTRRLVEGEWVDGPTTFWDIVCFGAQAEHIIASLTKGGYSAGQAWREARVGSRGGRGRMGA